jgi:hypothetical protein
MRKAGLPTFRKLWGRNDDVTLEKGTYRVNVTYSEDIFAFILEQDSHEKAFDVLRFSGTKALVFSRVGILGIRNDFIPISFLAVGSVSGFMALVIYFWRPRKLGDHSYLSWVRKAEEIKEKSS